jgi:hypothetical protein
MEKLADSTVAYPPIYRISRLTSDKLLFPSKWAKAVGSVMISVGAIMLDTSRDNACVWNHEQNAEEGDTKGTNENRHADHVEVSPVYIFEIPKARFLFLVYKYFKGHILVLVLQLRVTICTRRRWAQHSDGRKNLIDNNPWFYAADGNIV